MVNVKANRITLSVTGMTCQHCVGRVKSAVEAVAGTADINVNLDSGSVSFSVEGQDNTDRVREAIKAAGYDVAPAS